MAEKQIAWASGDGYITVIFGGDGNGSVSVTSDENESIDREQMITIQTTFGDNPKQAQVRVMQLGMREIFNVAEGAFNVAEGTFNVLKE